MHLIGRREDKKEASVLQWKGWAKSLGIPPFCDNSSFCLKTMKKKSISASVSLKFFERKCSVFFELSLSSSAGRKRRFAKLIDLSIIVKMGFTPPEARKILKNRKKCVKSHGGRLHRLNYPKLKTTRGLFWRKMETAPREVSRKWGPINNSGVHHPKSVSRKITLKTVL